MGLMGVGVIRVVRQCVLRKKPIGGSPFEGRDFGNSTSIRG